MEASLFSVFLTDVFLNGPYLSSAYKSIWSVCLIVLCRCLYLEENVLAERGNKWIDFSAALPSVVIEHCIPGCYSKLRIICVWQHVFQGNTGWIAQNMQNAWCRSSEFQASLIYQSCYYLMLLLLITLINLSPATHCQVL